jgi:hypothetical protein
MTQTPHAPDLDLSFPLPSAGDERIVSSVVYSMRKAGSTMLRRVLESLAKEARVAFANISRHYFRLGVAPEDIPASVAEVFRPRGYCYGVFRDPDTSFDIPILDEARIILQIRDPRDMLVSDYFSIAFSHAPPGSAAGSAYLEQFLANRARVRQMGVDEFVLQKAGKVLDVYERYAPLMRRPSVRIDRYEDLIFAKRAWIRGLVDFLGWPVSAEACDRIADENDVVPEAEQQDKMIRKVAPGDHLEKLRPETIARQNERFAKILEAHAYAMDASRAA